MADEIRILPFDRRNASDAEVAALTRFANAIRAETWPDDPPRSEEDVRRQLAAIPAFMRIDMEGAWTPSGDLVATGKTVTWDVPHNRHTAGFEIDVLPEYRRRGIARRLLTGVVRAAHAAGRTLLITETWSSVPAGTALMERLGADVGLTSHVNRLDLETLDRQLLRAWLEETRALREGFQLGWWENPYPEDRLSEIAAMKEAVNLMPRGNLQMEDFHVTPEILRQEDASTAARGSTRWTAYVRSAEGPIAGYTEAYWHPSNPRTVQQADTAVFPEYQNRGVGRWLKAAMLDRLLRERPEVRWIRTGNADSNAPMLKLNRQLGFQPYRACSVWQVAVADVEEYLASNRHDGENRAIEG